MADSLILSHQVSLGIRRALLAASLLALPSICAAANNCPWINEATASGLIGGVATGSYTAASSTQPALCIFIQTAPDAVRTLRITVQQTPDFQSRLDAEAKACSSSAAPLKAIGNQAILCSGDGGKRVFVERVIGRVRDQVFTITLGTTGKDDFVLTLDERKKRIATAAEQVAGNLF